MSRRRMARWIVASLLVTAAVVPVRTTPSAAVEVPAGFVEQVAFSGLTQPTELEFAPDGRVFVAEKGGRIKVFDGLADTTATLFADLSANVHNQWDRGLLGMALPPDFPANPWVYVLYAYDAPPGQAAPYYNDSCAAVAGGANGGNCVVTGRLSRLEAAGNAMTGAEQVLIHDWCQQFPSHSIGDLEFGRDGMLYATGGDGASFNAVDYGQFGSPTVNPCADPPGGTMAPPSAEGGALRSQDLRTPADQTTLDGALLRLDPVTGAGAPGNPLSASADANARRIVANGLRNPFRLTIDQDDNEAWISETGWSTYEEVNRLVVPATGVANFGWPCYEGTPRQSGYDAANLSICESLYAAGTGAVVAPVVEWHHASKPVANEICPTGSSSSTGVALYPNTGGPYPSSYNGAVFFADYSRSCIWARLATGVNTTFASNASSPVDLELGPGNELYYVDLNGGTVRRVRYYAGNRPPVAAISAAPTEGPAPLTVAFNAAASTDPDPADQGRLRYAWDFTDDGTTDSTAAAPTFTYAGVGTYTARLTVTDTLDVSDTTTVTIRPGGSSPTATIDTPTAGTTWRVGDTVAFSGRAIDPQQGVLPASALAWTLTLYHCPSTCHTHDLATWQGVASGSFAAPDHEYPSYLELKLVARDAEGLTSTVVRRLDPRTVTLTFATKPGNLQLVVGSTAGTASFTRTVIQGATMSVSAPSPQRRNKRDYTFASWSDGGAQTHVITASTVPTTYTASYVGR
jgi:glucose/arabinose dehydrogenase